MMGTINENSVQLKVYVDKQKKKVMFAEAEEDFVDILFSFMTLPLGTIARLSRKYSASKDIKVGSLTCLYESVMNLNEKLFPKPWYRDVLVHPINSSSSMCQKLKVDLDEMSRAHRIVARYEYDSVLVQNMDCFIITDSLNVVPVMLETSIMLLNSLGVENVNLLEERTMCFGLEQFLNLLKWSLLTDNPLTNLVLGGGKPCSSSCITNSTFSNTALTLTNSSQKVKLMVQKSKGKLLCAQVKNYFMEMLFSFLTIPLGAFVHLTKDDSSPILGVNNLYNSVSSLGDENYLKSEDVKTKLLFPKLADSYFRATDFLPIYEDKARPGHFLKKQGTFIVSNDLEVRASPSIATISNFNTLGVPVADMEVLEVGIGEHEALLLLKASLTSTSALTDCFNTFIKKPQDLPVLPSMGPVPKNPPMVSATRPVHNHPPTEGSIKQEDIVQDPKAQPICSRPKIQVRKILNHPPTEGSTKQEDIVQDPEAQPICSRTKRRVRKIHNHPPTETQHEDTVQDPEAQPKCSRPKRRVIKLSRFGDQNQ